MQDRRDGRDRARRAMTAPQPATPDPEHTAGSARASRRTARGGRSVMTAGRLLPGLGSGPQLRHWVPAGTQELPDCERHYLAVCGAVALRAATGQGSEWESWPVHDVCAAAGDVTGEAVCAPLELRWVEAGGQRHGYDGPRPAAGTEIRVLCDELVVVGRECIYGDPECPVCDWLWRALAGIEQRDAHTPHE